MNTLQNLFDSLRQKVIEGKDNVYMVDGGWMKTLSEKDRLWIHNYFEEYCYFETVTTEDVICFENNVSLSGIHSHSGEGTSSEVEFVSGDSNSLGEGSNSGVESFPTLVLPLSDQESVQNEDVIRAKQLGPGSADPVSPCGIKCKTVKLHVADSNAHGVYRSRLRFEEVFDSSQTGFLGTLFPTKPLSISGRVVLGCCQEEDKVCLKIFFLRGDIEERDHDKVLSCMRISVSAEVAGEALQLQYIPKSEDTTLRVIDISRATEDFYSFQKRQGMDIQLSPSASMNIATATPSLSLGQLTITGNRDPRDLQLLRARNEELRLVTLERGCRHVRNDQEFQSTLELKRNFSNTWFCNRSSEQNSVEFSDATLPITLMATVPDNVLFDVKSLIVTCSVELDISQILIGNRTPRAVIAGGKRKCRTFSFSKQYVLCGE